MDPVIKWRILSMHAYRCIVRLFIFGFSSELKSSNGRKYGLPEIEGIDTNRSRRRQYFQRNRAPIMLSVYPLYSL